MQGKEGYPRSRQVNTMKNRNFASLLDLSQLVFDDII